MILDAEGLDEGAMRSIAAEMNLSETAFLLPPTRGDADFRIRWFTPAVEVDLCGHATVAAFHAALESGRIEPGEYRLECRSGVLRVGVERAEGSARISMSLPVPEIAPIVEAEIGPLLDGLGLSTEALDPSLPVMRSTEWALVPCQRLEVVRALRPDLRALREHALRTGVGSVIPLTTETVDEGSLVHLRMFAPVFGIDEDPVTGSAQGPIAAYLAANGRLEGRESVARYIAEQGDAIGRPGRVEVLVAVEERRVDSITIRGRAVTVMRGRILAP